MKPPTDPEGRRLPVNTTCNGKFGYAEITPALRARIFGLNAAQVYGLSPAHVKKYLARDPLARERTAYLERPQPHFRTYGPRTRREFLRLRALARP